MQPYVPQLLPITDLDYSIHKKTSSGLLRQLKQADILRDLQPSGGRRSAVLCFPRLINLAEGRSVL
jgi:hypothetical protein